MTNSSSTKSFIQLLDEQSQFLLALVISLWFVAFAGMFTLLHIAYEGKDGACSSSWCNAKKKQPQESPNPAVKGTSRGPPVTVRSTSRTTTPAGQGTEDCCVELRSIPPTDTATILRREPDMAILSAIGYLAFVTNMLMGSLNANHCSDYQPLGVGFLGVTYSGLFARLWMLRFQFNANQQRQRSLQNLAAVANEKPLGCCFSKSLGSWRAKYVIFGGLCALWAILCGMLFHKFPSSVTCSMGANQFMMVFVGGLAVLFNGLILWFTLRGIKDGFVIMREFQLLVPVLSFSILYSMLQYFKQPYAALVVLGLSALLFLFCTLYFPLFYLSMAYSDHPNNHADFGEMMSDWNEGRKIFRAFLKKEWSEENICILDEIEQFEKEVGRTKSSVSSLSGISLSSLTMSTSITTATRTAQEPLYPGTSTQPQGDILTLEQAAKAREIFNKYIAEDSMIQVNVSAKNRLQIQDALGIITKSRASGRGISMKWGVSKKRLDPDVEQPKAPIKEVRTTVFDNVKMEIRKLISKDSFARFLRSPLGETYLKKKGKEAAKKKWVCYCCKIVCPMSGVCVFGCASCICMQSCCCCDCAHCTC